MKIFNFGLDIEPGKQKYKSKEFERLVKKFSPQKLSPHLVEFINEGVDIADAIVFDINKKLDLVLIDLEKIEKRLLKIEDVKEKELLVRAQQILEEENLLCDAEFSAQEGQILSLLQLVTYKPCLGVVEVGEINNLIEKVIEKANIILFFTAGKKEVKAWSIKKGENILEAAGKIHSDLKRGFIKADIVKACDLGSFFNMAEAKAKGFMKVVDRDYIVQDGDIVEIRFSV